MVAASKKRLPDNTQRGERWSNSQPINQRDIGPRDAQILDEIINENADGEGLARPHHDDADHAGYQDDPPIEKGRRLDKAAGFDRSVGEHKNY